MAIQVTVLSYLNDCNSLSPGVPYLTFAPLQYSLQIKEKAQQNNKKHPSHVTFLLRICHLTLTKSQRSRNGLQGPTWSGPWLPLWHFLLTFRTKLQPHWAPCPSLNTPLMLLPQSIWNPVLTTYNSLLTDICHGYYFTSSHSLLKCHPHHPHQHELSYLYCYIFRCSTLHHFIFTYISPICYIYSFTVWPSHSPITL